MPRADGDIQSAPSETAALSDPKAYEDAPPSLPILGVPVSLVDMAAAVGLILSWAGKHQEQYVCVRDVHGLMLSVEDPEMMRIQWAAGMVTPDGMPLVWVCKLRAQHKVGRVCGSDLMDALCDAGRSIGLRHYFYGGKPGIPERLIANLTTKYPGLAVAGYRSPPFRALTAEEDAADIDAINRAGAQIVWVGLGTPKQEYWMRDHVGRIEGGTLIGVGAAFDFQSGTLSRAPKWMQTCGLESLHRLASEPRRLWRRYLVTSPMFLFELAAEQLALSLGKTPRHAHRAASAEDKTASSPR